MEKEQKGVENALSQKASDREQYIYTGQIQTKGWHHQLQMCHKQTDSPVDTEEQKNKGSAKHAGCHVKMSVFLKDLDSSTLICFGCRLITLDVK